MVVGFDLSLARLALSTCLHLAKLGKSFNASLCLLQKFSKLSEPVRAFQDNFFGPSSSGTPTGASAYVTSVSGEYEVLSWASSEVCINHYPLLHICAVLDNVFQ